MPESDGDLGRADAIMLDLVSHELRSPLTAIRGYAQTLLRRAGRLPLDDQEEFLQAILQSAHRLEYCLDQMLMLAELRAGRVSRPSGYVDVANLAREVVQFAGAQAQVVARPVATSGDSPLPPPTIALRLLADEADETHLASARGDAIAFPVLGDVRRLHDTLAHILGNALRHSPQGSAVVVQVRAAARDRVFAEAAARGVLSLEASAEALQPAHDAEKHDELSGESLPSLLAAPYTIEVAVNDEGPGIALEHLELIFEPFYQVDQHLTRGVEGLGLGLAICREVIRLHDGLIWAESAPGVGTSIRILLPRREENLPTPARRSRRRR